MKTYLYSADILLPKKDFERWAVIACDQYTSDRGYWKEVEDLVGDVPSALNIILPEVYLAETEQRVQKINETMQEYLDNGVFNTLSNSLIYVEREITGGALRRGVIGMIDLEEYEYTGERDAIIRSTEQTVSERIPPRVKIRKNAPLELPHVMLFINDPEDTVIGQLTDKKGSLEKLYDFSLMKNSGNIKGFKVCQNDAQNINLALDRLSKEGFVFAVGDGNHSLATAKECYRQSGNGNCRYALVEVVNIYEKSIEFEPIYRVLFGCDKEHLLGEMKKKLNFCDSVDSQKITIVTKGNEEEISVMPTAKLPVGTLQTFLDGYIAENPSVEIDYIHGIEDTKRLCQMDGAVGFIFDGMKKDELFSAVAADGSLPRKTFSMGHADDKRFYIEARKLK